MILTNLPCFEESEKLLARWRLTDVINSGMAFLKNPLPLFRLEWCAIDPPYCNDNLSPSTSKYFSKQLMISGNQFSLSFSSKMFNSFSCFSSADFPISCWMQFVLNLVMWDYLSSESIQFTRTTPLWICTDISSVSIQLKISVTYFWSSG